MNSPRALPAFIDIGRREPASEEAISGDGNYLPMIASTLAALRDLRSKGKGPKCSSRTFAMLFGPLDPTGKL
jgi:hypothetical protein